MSWQMILALVLIIPLIVLPVAFVWYLNIRGAVVVLRRASRKAAASRTNAV